MNNPEKEKRGRKANLNIYQKIKKYTFSGTKEWNFIHTLNIPVKVILDNEWDLDIIDISVFIAISNFIHYGKPIKTTEADGSDWYYISENKIMSDLPLVPLNSKSAIYKRISNLIKHGLIERNPNNVSTGKKNIRIGEQADKLVYALYKGK